MVAIDLGSYALKIFEISLEKKQISLQNRQTIPHPTTHHHPTPPKGASLTSLQLQAIKDYLDQRGPERGKKRTGPVQIIFQWPSTYTTTRYLEIPTPNRRKAELIIPFQLDDILPFPSSQIHYALTMEKKANSTAAIVAVAELPPFDDFYKKMDSLGVIPKVLTSELSPFHSYAKEMPSFGPCCILDMGHTTTKAYFLANGQVVSNHTSRIGGNLIGSIIAHHYKIDEEEAIRYKHEHSFFLTEGQYKTVTQEQAHFGHLMKQAVLPLIQEYKRWELGLRVQYGRKVEVLYITGGMSRIKNTANFLSQALSTQVVPLDPFTSTPLKTPKGIPPLSDGEKNSYALSYLMASIFSRPRKSSVPLANFLRGDYSGRPSEGLPLHTTVFLASRGFIFSLIILLTLALEQHLLLKEQKILDRKVGKIIKTPSLEIPVKTQRSYKKKPQIVLKFLKNKNETLRQKIDGMASEKDLDVLAPLARLGHILSSNDDIDLIAFSYPDKDKKGHAMAKFQSERSSELEAIAHRLREVNLPQHSIQFKKGDNILTLNFKGK